MAAEGGSVMIIIIRYIYRGEVGEVIPREATHITVAEDCTFVHAEAFRGHHKIVEIICHDKVEKIEAEAFAHCSSMRRVIMPGVKIVERWAFYGCPALEDVECGKLEIIGASAFGGRKSLSSIDLPSVRIVERHAFLHCRELVNVKFGNKMERIDREAFYNCESLKRITIPFRDGLMTTRNIIQGCSNLKRVDLVGGEIQETIAALQLEEWRNDMNEEIDSINQILPTTHAGYYDEEEEKWITGEKVRAIWTWMRSVVAKIMHYQVELNAYWTTPLQPHSSTFCLVILCSIMSSLYSNCHHTRSRWGINQ